MKFIKPKARSILSLDIGKKRIGLAYCDPLFITTSILTAVKRCKNHSELSIIQSHIERLKISGIVIGLPLDDKGNMTKQAEDCLGYGEMLSKEIDLPYTFVNEHSTTWESINRYGIKKDKSGLVDSFSAKIILEQWMEEGPEFKEYTFNNPKRY